MAEEEDEQEVEEQDEQEAPKKKRKKRKKRKRDEGSAIVYYLTFFGDIFTFKNAATLVGILVGIGLAVTGFLIMTAAGIFGLPWLVAGAGLVVLSLAMRFVFFPNEKS